jgi:hypothetical protein
MRTVNLLAAVAAAALAFLSNDSVAQGAADAGEPVRVQIDNDLFSGHHRDRDYTGGAAVTISNEAARTGLTSLNPVLAKIDAIAGAREGEIYFARQFGMLAFTPADIETSEALDRDRPYANLVYIANGRIRVEDDQRTAWVSNLTVGILGLGLAEQLQTAIHQVVGSASPEGYAHQISAGGEPTARYALARQFLLIAHPSGRLDVKTTIEGSVGYLTETSVAISARIGRLHSAWWSFAPELTDYMAAPIAADAHAHGELYVFSGVRFKARAYNAFLQGQFRHSDVRYSSSEIQHFLVHAWIGLAMQLADRTDLTYTLNYQSAELREGDAVRDALWGAVQVTHEF